MERLTKPATKKTGNEYVSAIGSGHGAWPRIIQRLAAYENTGLEPEEIQSKKGCEYCTGVVKTFPTHCDGEAYITKLTPLPAIDLMTGEMADTADPPFFAIRTLSDENGEDFVPIRFCPKCGRELKEV